MRAKAQHSNMLLAPKYLGITGPIWTVEGRIAAMGVRLRSRWALSGRIHAGGDSRRPAGEYAGAVGVVTGRFAPENLRPRFGMSPIRPLAVAATDNGPLAPERASGIGLREAPAMLLGCGPPRSERRREHG